MSFILDKRLEQSSFFVTDLPLCQVRLSHDSRYPWLILIPRVHNICEVFDLTAQQQLDLWVETTTIAEILHQQTHPHKMNIATLGNVVGQLHMHVVARFTHDAAWPHPIWGHGAPIPYNDQTAATLIDKCRKQLITTLSSEL